MRLSEIVVKINRSLRNLKSAKLTEAQAHANNVLKNLLNSSEAPGLFGHVFGTACAYRYLRKMSFYCILDVGPDFYYYVAKISMTSQDTDKYPQLEARVREVNHAFNQLDYPRLRNEALPTPGAFIDDLTKVRSISTSINPIQTVLNEALANINKIQFTLTN
jgi:hypothetical protein